MSAFAFTTIASLLIVLTLASVEDQLRKIFFLFLVFDSTFMFFLQRATGGHISNTWRSYGSVALTTAISISMVTLAVRNIFMVEHNLSLTIMFDYSSRSNQV